MKNKYISKNKVMISVPEKTGKRMGVLTMSKHTPGKWRLGTRNGERAIYGPKGEEIAVFTGMLFNDEELANARLIAAAPELLSACIEAEVLLKEYPVIERMVKAAIAKAEGRA